MRIKLSCVALFAFVVAFIASAQQPSKTPVPSEAAYARGMKLVGEVFGDDLTGATTPDKKVKLANILFQQGKEVKDDAVVRYVCFREARNLAANANETGLALAIVEEISRIYDVDLLTAKADVLSLAVASATEKETGLALVDAIRPLLAEAIDLDNYPAAHQLGKALVDAAKKAKSASLVLELQKRVEEIKGIEKSFGKVQGYLDRIAKDPNDGAAQLELGKYFAFHKKRWEKGLPYMAKSGDKGLEPLAKQDLADPKDPKDQLALADGWWDLAGAYKDSAKLAVQMRATHWYLKAVPTLSGINRKKAEKRIDVVQEILANIPTVVTPVLVGPVGEIAKYDAGSEEIKAVAFSNDGRYIASGGKDQTIRVWDVSIKDAKPTFIKGHTKEIWGLAFHPNNRHLFSASWDATVRMWDFRSTNEVKRYTHGKDVNAVALSRDGSTMLSGSDDRNVYSWNTATGDEIRRYTGHSDFVYAVAFSPDGRYVASGGVDKSVRVYQRDSGQLVKSFEGHIDSVTNVAFTADSRYVLSSGDSMIHVWDITTGKEAPRRFEGGQGRISAMAISPDGRRLLTGDDRSVKYWDAATGKMLQSFTGHTNTVTCVAFSHDGRRAVSGSYDGSVRLWGLPSR